MSTNPHRATAKALLRWANRPVAQRRFRRTISKSTGALRINVGCGPAPLPGWLNTDVSFRAKHYLDVTRPWPVPPGSVSHVYADNVIEHLNFECAQKFLRFAFASQQQGGRIRLVTPDVERIANLYLHDRANGLACLERHRRHGYEVHHAVDLLRIAFSTSGHERGYLWDYSALSAELAAAGYGQVERFDCGESDDPIMQGLETRVEPTDLLTSLVVEALKTD